MSDKAQTTTSREATPGPQLEEVGAEEQDQVSGGTQYALSGTERQASEDDGAAGGTRG